MSPSPVLGRLFGELRVPVIGVLHAPPLPGAPKFEGSMARIRRHVLRELDCLASGGIDGVILENFGDAPFFPDRVPAVTIAALTTLATDIRRHGSLPLGLNVLRNDGRAALAIAASVDAQFIRVNVLCGARVTDQGIVQGIAHDLLRERAWLKADDIAIFADVNVKHSAPLAHRSLAAEVADTVQRGGADAIIVTGKGTGMSACAHELSDVKGMSGPTSVLLGSGIDADNLSRYREYMDGIIVGTSLKVDGIVTNPVDSERVQRLMDAVRDLRASESR